MIQVPQAKATVAQISPLFTEKLSLHITITVIECVEICTEVEIIAGSFLRCLDQRWKRHSTYMPSYQRSRMHPVGLPCCHLCDPSADQIAQVDQVASAFVRAKTTSPCPLVYNQLEDLVAFSFARAKTFLPPPVYKLCLDMLQRDKKKTYLSRSVMFFYVQSLAIKMKTTLLLLSNKCLFSIYNHHSL
jgi:hypothetical protein